MLSRPTALTMGTVGTGKSTFNNCMIGSSAFKTSSGIASCTEDFQLANSNGIDFIDTPGLGAADLPTGIWIENLKEKDMVKTRINLAIVILKAKYRAEAQDKLNILVLLEALEGLNPENVAVVFTHCDLPMGQYGETFTHQRGCDFVDFFMKQLADDGY